MSSVEAFGPSSQTLTFNESDELIGGGTQATDYEFTDFTMPSQSQSLNSQDMDPDGSLKPRMDQQLIEEEDEFDDDDAMSKGMDKLQFQDDDEFDDVNETIQTKDLPAHACCYCGVHDPMYVVRCHLTKKANRLNIQECRPSGKSLKNLSIRGQGCRPSRI